MAQKPAAFRLGVYVGQASDVTCPGDNITYEVLLQDARKCTVESIPQLSYFMGGQPPWHLEGSWELDGQELVVAVTKQDVTGPRKDTDLRLPVDAGGRLSLRGTWCSWKAPPPEDDKLRAKQEELQRFAAETQAKQAELEALRAEQDEEARREQERLQRLREEVQRQREQHEAELAQAEEERTQLAAEREEQEAAFARQREELDALRRAQEELRRSREEARRLKDEQQKELAEQQSLLDAERSKVESERAAREAERVARQAEMEAQKEELLRQRQEVQRQQAEEEEFRVARDEAYKLVDQELRDRADHLVQTEEALSQERQRIMKSRSSLTAVQASFINSMLEKGKNKEVNLDDCDEEPEVSMDALDAPVLWQAEDMPDKEASEAAATGVDVWNMEDWSNVESKLNEIAP